MRVNIHVTLCHDAEHTSLNFECFEKNNPLWLGNIHFDHLTLNKCIACADPNWKKFGLINFKLFCIILLCRKIWLRKTLCSLQREKFFMNSLTPSKSVNFYFARVGNSLECSGLLLRKRISQQKIPHKTEKCWSSYLSEIQSASVEFYPFFSPFSAFVVFEQTWWKRDSWNEHLSLRGYDASGCEK